MGSMVGGDTMMVMTFGFGLYLIKVGVENLKEMLKLMSALR
jgi:hypothetical protein